MGGCFQHKTFSSVKELVEDIKVQIEEANNCNLYLLQGEIKQLPSFEGGFEWTAYFSK